MNDIIYVTNLINSKNKCKSVKTVCFVLFPVFLTLVFGCIGGGIYFISKWYEEVYPSHLPLIDFKSMNYIFVFACFLGAILFLILAAMFLCFGVYNATKYEGLITNIERAFESDHDQVLTNYFAYGKTPKKDHQPKAEEKNNTYARSEVRATSKKNELTIYENEKDSVLEKEDNGNEYINLSKRGFNLEEKTPTSPSKVKKHYPYQEVKDSEKREIPFIDVEAEVNKNGFASAEKASSRRGRRSRRGRKKASK